ncbi:MAG: sulfotransferase [Xenococcaceae cyanobacterium MO_167.B27]|nr:sulfotransferase [Xenococcaceae cyanobacterium MO_167.B27]
MDEILTSDRGSLQRITKAFCVGQAKSGTASLYALLSHSYRVAHEPERAKTLKMILRHSEGEVDAQSFKAYLRQRDQRLNLEYDIAWANQFIIDHLLTVFPEARYIVLIRDPYTWLQSTVGHLISRQIPPDVPPFLNWWFKPKKYSHTSHDRLLEAQGVYSITALVNAWNHHVQTCTQLLPPERCLVLKTHELNSSHQQLADFLQIPWRTLERERGHLNKSKWNGRLDSLVNTNYLSEVVNSMCADSMTRYFPDVSNAEDAYKLWGQNCVEQQR